jgi:predicted PurR-regulated permease PerM
VVIALSQGAAPGIYVLIFMTVLQFIVTSVLSPKIIGEIIGVHPVLVILALIAGGELGGMVGMIVAVPLTSVVLIFLKYYWPMFLED